MIKLLTVGLLLILSVNGFSQINDTIIDSEYSWKELKKIFELKILNNTNNNFSAGENLLARQLIDNDLVLLPVTYFGFDSMLHKGQIVCNKAVVSDLKGIFEELLPLRFPIEQVTPVSQYDYTYNKSMDDNYTYSFDFRLETNSKKFSNHSSGFALDINPVQNPYKSGKKTFPPNAKEKGSTGRIRYTDPIGKKVIELFKKYGWSWGGDWKSVKDYMHFQKP